MTSLTLSAMRASAVAHSLAWRPTLQAAIDALGFVQADPIRAPARAQDLTLRQRVGGYLAGDLERHYTGLRVEEAFFINYGFVTPELFALMHPRGDVAAWPAARRAQARALLAFLEERREAHPREVAAHFAHGRVTNYWGGSSSATTHMLDQLHYLGLVRVARREAGVRVYGVRSRAVAPATRPSASAIDARLDTLVDVLVAKYAPLPWASLAALIRRLRAAAPQWQGRLGKAVVRARARFPHARIDGVEWYWPDGMATGVEVGDQVRLLAPFDPVVWDRRRFELLWNWAYRFEAYTPAPKRTLGYYALPLLWRSEVIGWANVSVDGGGLQVETGYVAGRPPSGRAFRQALEAECASLGAFLGVSRLGRPETTKRRT